jgi:hypothetical protein
MPEFTRSVDELIPKLAKQKVHILTQMFALPIGRANALDKQLPYNGYVYRVLGNKLLCL